MKNACQPCAQEHALAETRRCYGDFVLRVFGVIVITFLIVVLFAPLVDSMLGDVLTYNEWLDGFECSCYGGTLRVGIPGEPNTLNWWVASSAWSQYVLWPIYDRLVRYVNGSLTYELAESIEWSKDHMSLTIKLREGVKWHDGKPLTAEDVAFTINTLAAQSWTFPHGFFKGVEKAVVLDNYTVRIFFRKPNPGFISTLSYVNIMPKHVWEPVIRRLGENTTQYAPRVPEDLVGSGPFRIVRYVPGQYVEYEAFKDYWLGRPCVDKLIIVFIKEANAGLMALEKGEIDVYDGYLTPEILNTTKQSIRYQVFIRPTIYYWGFNDGKWPYNNTLFRKALAFSVDREALVRNLLMGYGLPGNPGVVPPVGANKQWFNPNATSMVTYNPSMTAKILDKLGFKDIDGDGWREAPSGEEFAIRIFVPSYDVIRVRAAEMITEWLAHLPGGGLRVEVKVMDWKTLWPIIKNGKAESFLLGSTPSNDISWLYYRFHTKGPCNWYNFSDPEIDELTEKLMEVFDEKERRMIAWRIQVLLAEKNPIIPLYYRGWITPYRTDVFTGWFEPSDDSVVNRITLLKLHKLACTVEEKPETPSMLATIATIMFVTAVVLAVFAARKKRGA